MSNDVSSNFAAYEFNAEQSKLIGGLGRSMRIVGLVALVWAVVGIISMSILAWTRGVLILDLNPVLALFIGLWALSGGASFVNVASTQGNDISHLMDALGKLRNIFTLVAILIIAAVLIAIAALAYVLIFHPAGASLVVGGHPVA